MNNTTTTNNNDSIFIYIMLSVELLNAVIVIWTSYKLTHLNFIIDHIDCCCCEFTGVNIEVSD